MERRKRSPLPLDASPQEKYDNLILTFFEEWQEFDGQEINFGDFFETRSPNYLGFQNHHEFIFYIRSLIVGKLVSINPQSWITKVISGLYYEIPLNPRVTFEGLNYCLSLLESGKNSTRCFVAMAFKDDTERFYNEGIAKAIEENSFRPIRVDKEHTENEQTINDFIIASIKQSRFCVADLTHQRNGVYFEAGYAFGRGLKVILTCHRKHLKKVHFDLKPMQIVLYSTPEELREALSLKIQAFVLD